MDKENVGYIQYEILSIHKKCNPVIFSKMSGTGGHFVK
jgi:hypothetical protein